MESIKDKVHRIVDQLPEEATWDDFIRQVEVCQAIEAGLNDVREGRTCSMDEVRKRLGLKEASDDEPN